MAEYNESDPNPSSKSRRLEPAQRNLLLIILTVTVGSLTYRGLMNHGLGHSGAMFVGLPAILAMLLAVSPKAKTVTGGIVKGITLFLLIVAPLLGEGYLCILVASPLFYLVGIIVGLIDDAARRKRDARLRCTWLILLPMSLEGVLPGFTIGRSQTVEVTRILAATPQQVETALARSPRVGTPMPRYLRIGFPRPIAAWGTGLSVGSPRTIHFTGAEGDPPGDLRMQVAERRPGYLRFTGIDDSSKLTQWIRWESSEVAWSAVDPAHTAVTWRIHFARQLDPAWYFIPWERTAVHEAAVYLIEANATPQARP
ncbi:hypothetical protein SAMN05421770_101800 [Granulicella rosea]|uniref:Polyketide cyclase / dehydrase and lipid transport n=1 Tax=Granulicella rosea TaxID=474952 RepID=A0A239E4N1_9BACT|nr:hypothetical protein [Granulicella rosea]SNS39695.1 hypothetical protein SAMN05421770_101800 [Granulicella rosea]